MAIATVPVEVPMAIKDMTLEELERQAEDLPRRMDQIRTQLDRAKVEAATTGRYADASWFSDATRALRINGRRHQLVLQELSKRKKAAKQAQAQSVERRFVDLARATLDPEVFRGLMQMALNPSPVPQGQTVE